MVEQNNNLVLFSGTSNVSLSEKVAQELGKDLGDASPKSFPSSCATFSERETLEVPEKRTRLLFCSTIYLSQ